MNNEIEIRGENKRFLESKNNMRLLVGPCVSGKTYTAMLHIHLLCKKYDNLRCLLARKSLPSLRNSAVQTLKYIIDDLGDNDKVRILGEKRPTDFIYSNGSQIILSQIDKMGKALAGEYDLVCIHEPACEGLTLDEFILVISKARKRDVLPCPLIIAEGSLPVEEEGKREHWIYDLPDYGFEVFNPSMKDNPRYYNWTDLGLNTLNMLQQLPEHIRKNQLEGKWEIQKV